MKILWITNMLFPEPLAKLTGNSCIKGSGGWMTSSADILANSDNIELCVVTVSTLVHTLTKICGKKIVYYIIPYGKGNKKYNKGYEKYFIEIKEKEHPDIVHIHGTEFTHGLSYVNACGNENVVVSIQGLKSVIADYYCAGITLEERLMSLTFRDILKGGIGHEANNFRKQGKYEIELLSKVHHVIGRTEWDRARTWAINPCAEYHFCNETLRPEFYDGSKWNYNKCNKHTIFLSQAGYPIKGLHQVLKAMPIILRHYPDTSIRVAGGDITKCSTLSEKLRLSGYGRYIKRLIKKNALEGKVTFTGNLNGAQMMQEYLHANVFVCPSTIENSPNSLGEAQILGTPCVASYVGGVMDMMRGDEEHLYRFEEVEMLAAKVCGVFADAEKQVDMRAVALRRHDGNSNSNNLLLIYKNITNS